MLSALLVMGAGLWFYFITQSNKVMIMPAVVLLGFGFSAMLVIALSFVAELIGDKKVSVISYLANNYINSLIFVSAMYILMNATFFTYYY